MCVSASTGEDGAIAITTVSSAAGRCREGTFTFVREEVARVGPSGDEPAARWPSGELVRAGCPRHRAERERYEVATT